MVCLLGCSFVLDALGFGGLLATQNLIRGMAVGFERGGAYHDPVGGVLGLATRKRFGAVFRAKTLAYYNP